jgi:putative exporter of polyketide antibiotics
MVGSMNLEQKEKSNKREKTNANAMSDMHLIVFTLRFLFVEHFNATMIAIIAIDMSELISSSLVLIISVYSLLLNARSSSSCLLPKK